MTSTCLRILPGRDIREILAGREIEIVEVVRRAYELHARDATVLPRSVFLRLPERAVDRMIALPAYVGGERPVAGIKWISSFPGNHAFGLARASAVIVINSMSNGQPELVMEGSIVSAKRTAASAALAANLMSSTQAVETIGIIGCGVINLEVLRFLLATGRAPACVLLYDIDPTRATCFQRRALEILNGIRCRVAGSIDDALSGSDVVSIATTEAVPHILNPQQLRAGTTVLHISLRDFSPEVILSAHNVVDDVQHVCAHQTSVHLTSEHVPPAEFIHCTLGDLILGRTQPFKDRSKPIIFSPFGLGVLDLALASFVREVAERQGCGQVIEDFFETSPHFTEQGVT